MVYQTTTGKIITSITIKPEVRTALKQKGIPLGTACELWLNNVDKIKADNEHIRRMEFNIIKLQEVVGQETARARALEDELKKIKEEKK